MKERIHFFFPALEFVPVMATSAVTGYGIDRLCSQAVQLKKQLERKVETSELNKKLQDWLNDNPLPGKRRLKIRYATQISTNPVKFVFFVNHKHAFPQTYINYLKNRIRAGMGFRNIPVDIDIRES